MIDVQYHLSIFAIMTWQAGNIGIKNCLAIHIIFMPYIFQPVLSGSLSARQWHPRSRYQFTIKLTVELNVKFNIIMESESKYVCRFWNSLEYLFNPGLKFIYFQLETLFHSWNFWGGDSSYFDFAMLLHKFWQKKSKMIKLKSV